MKTIKFTQDEVQQYANPLKDLINSCHLIDSLLLKHEIDLDKSTVRDLKRLSRELKEWKY